MEQLNLRVLTSNSLNGNNLTGNGQSPRIKLEIEKGTAINVMKVAQKEHKESQASHLDDHHMSFIELERMEDPRTAYTRYPDVRQPNQDGPDWNYTYHIFSGDPFIDMFIGRDNQGKFFLTNQPLPYGTQDENNFACDFDLFDENTGAVLTPILKAMAGTMIHYKINEEALIGMPEMTLVTIAPFVQAILQAIANDQSPHQLDSKNTVTGIDLGTIEDGWTFHPYKIENGQVFDPMWGKYVQIAKTQANDVFKYGAQTVVHLVTDFTGPNQALVQDVPHDVPHDLPRDLPRDVSQAEGYLLTKHTGDSEVDTIQAVKAVPVPAVKFGRYKFAPDRGRDGMAPLNNVGGGTVELPNNGGMLGPDLDSETELHMPTVRPIHGSNVKPVNGLDNDNDNGNEALASEQPFGLTANKKANNFLLFAFIVFRS